jgi:hypothetical protein
LSSRAAQKRTRATTLKHSSFDCIYWTLHEEYAYRSGLDEDRCHHHPF